MTSFILIVCGLAFGTICLGVGYLIGKKKKVIARATAVIDKAKEVIDTVKK